ncbi:MAG: hypothetical protein ACLR2E_16975 [Lachnospiraceae bacterium]
MSTIPRRKIKKRPIFPETPPEPKRADFLAFEVGEIEEAAP